MHPFSRELWGIQWCFAHNGDCPKFSNFTPENTPLLGQTTPESICFHPVGETDSEAAFCAVLNALKAEFPEGLPTLSVLHEFLTCVCEEISADHPTETIFNFLLGCGQYTLFAYSWPGKRPGSKVWNGLHYIVREPPFSTAKLLDVDYTIDFSAVTDATDRVAVITTKPLTEEAGWTEFRRGELIMFDKGLPYRTPKCCERVEEAGRGLCSKFIKSKCTRSPSFSSFRNKSRPPSPPVLVMPVTAVATDNGTDKLILSDQQGKEAAVQACVSSLQQTWTAAATAAVASTKSSTVEPLVEQENVGMEPPLATLQI